MRKALIAVVLLSSVLLIAAVVSGCSDSSVTPTPTATSQFAFMRFTGGNLGAQFAAREMHGADSNVAAAEIFLGAWDIYLSSITSKPGDETKVTTESGAFQSVRLSYDGKKAVFTAVVTDTNTHETYSQIFLVNMSDATNPVQLTSDNESHYEAELSQDGSKIVFWHFVGGVPQLAIISSSGGAETTVPNLSGKSSLAPSFTPDGKQIVFEYCDTDDVYIINTDGTGLTQLTNKGGVNTPSVSPDGTKIVFVRGPNDISIMGIGGEMGGTAATQLTTDHRSWDPMFVKDKIVFVTDNDDDGDDDIWSMNYDGTGAAAITHTAQNDRF